MTAVDEIGNESVPAKAATTLPAVGCFLAPSPVPTDRKASRLGIAAIELTSQESVVHFFKVSGSGNDFIALVEPPASPTPD